MSPNHDTYSPTMRPITPAALVSVLARRGMRLQCEIHLDLEGRLMRDNLVTFRQLGLGLDCRQL